MINPMYMCVDPTFMLRKEWCVKLTRTQQRATHTPFLKYKIQ